MSTSVTPAERLLDLVIALSHTEHRMTKADIRATVNGYSQASNDDAFERMFERDKVTLRELGVPLVTLTDDAHGDDIGYRIDLAGYDLPDIDLSSAEIGILSAAAQMWDGAHLDLPARRALTKLRAIAPAASPALSGHVLRIPPPSATFDPLLATIAANGVVTFSYRSATSTQASSRRVEPWRLIVRDGAWYLQGFDLDRGAERLFRLTRITGAVKVVRDVSAQHQRGALPAKVAGEADHGQATLAVLPERAGEVRLRAASLAPGTKEWSGHEILTLTIGDLEDLAGLIAGYTDAIVVLDPPVLRDAVISRLRAGANLAPPAAGSSGEDSRG